MLLVALSACQQDPVVEQLESVVSQDTLERSLVSVDDLPRGYERTPSDEVDGTADTGTCLDRLGGESDATGVEAAREAQAEFTSSPTPRQQSQVFVGVAAFEDESSFRRSFDAFVEEAKSCRRARGTRNGLTLDLRVRVDDEVTIEGADLQLTVTLSGRATYRGVRLDERFALIVAASGRELISAGVVDIGQGLPAGRATTLTRRLAQLQLTRLTRLR